MLLSKGNFFSFLISVDLVPQHVCIPWFNTELLTLREKFMELLIPVKFYALDYCQHEAHQINEYRL